MIKIPVITADAAAWPSHNPAVRRAIAELRAQQTGGRDRAAEELASHLFYRGGRLTRAPGVSDEDWDNGLRLLRGILGNFSLGHMDKLRLAGFLIAQIADVAAGVEAPK